VVVIVADERRPSQPPESSPNDYHIVVKLRQIPVAYFEIRHVAPSGRFLAAVAEMPDYKEDNAFLLFSVVARYLLLTCHSSLQDRV
jgi:hypothetical protein